MGGGQQITKNRHESQNITKDHKQSFNKCLLSTYFPWKVTLTDAGDGDWGGINIQKGTIDFQIYFILYYLFLYLYILYISHILYILYIVHSLPLAHRQVAVEFCRGRLPP